MRFPALYRPIPTSIAIHAPRNREVLAIRSAIGIIGRIDAMLPIHPSQIES